MARQKFKHFTPISYAKIVKNGSTVNLKVTFNVGDDEDEEHLIVVAQIYLHKGEMKPIIQSVITPDGVTHDADEIHNKARDIPESHKKWKKDIQKSLKRKFEDFKRKIEEFAKKIGGKERYDGKF